MPTIALFGALDTKGEEFLFLKRNLEQRGLLTLTVDTGILDAPYFEPDVSRHEVARAAGEDLAKLATERDRGRAVEAMSRGAVEIARRLHSEGRLDALMGMGGGAGTAVATAAMRALPFGLPKVAVSTMAGGDVRGYVDIHDIVLIPSVVDIAGLNRISRRVLAQAASAVAGMLEAEPPPESGRPLIGASMFGNTTPCVEAARRRLESEGYEVLVFHATGTGGRTLESLIDAGQIEAVLDVTTTELADELVGGVLSAGPARLDAAGRRGIPAVIAPGCLDMVNFWAPETVPERFSNRLFYPHNPNVTLMRTTREENIQLGRILAEKLNRYGGPVVVYLPLKGVSMLAAPGGPFHDPEADDSLFNSLKKNLRPEIPVREIDAGINDDVFARAVAEGLLELLKKEKKT